MAKKILMIVGALVLVAIVVLGVTMCGVKQVADEKLKEKEPQLRQYVQMTEVDQNTYVEKNMNELFTTIIGELKDDKEISKENLQKLESDPEAKAAGIQLGRSIVAMLIISSDNIVKDLIPADKDKYTKESDELSNRLDAYHGFMKKYGVAKEK